MDGRRIVLIILTVLIAVVAPGSVARADSVSYVIFDPLLQPADCTFGNGPGTYTVFVTLNLSAPAKALQCSAPPTCGGPGITWNYPVSGDPSSVLTVDFGGCISGSVTLFTAEFQVDNNCCPMLLNGPITIGPSQDSPPVLVGCDDTPRFLVPPCSANSPSLLTPPDGATTSLTPFMSWNYAFGDYCQEGIGLPIFTIFYGTNPSNLDQTLTTLETNEGTLPTLAPNTQYYWRVRIVDDFGWYTGSMVNFSPMWSFTTESTVQAEYTTWGAVKALFDE